jgi:hypothetical protein
MICKQSIGAGLVAAVLSVAAAQAETKVTVKAGGWEAFDGTPTNGKPVCGMSSSPKDQYFGLKHFSGDATFTIQIGKSSWRIENGSKQKLTMRLDSNKAWTATGTGMHFNDGDAGLEFTINKSELTQFIKEFGSSKRIVLHFIGSDASDWDILLDGVSTVKAAFETCNISLK